jgi:hypothetical protein
MERKMVLGHLHGRMDLNSLEISKMILSKVKVSTSGQTETNTKAIGLIIKCMVREYLFIKMAENMKVILKMIKKMAKALFTG